MQSQYKYYVGVFPGVRVDFGRPSLVLNESDVDFRMCVLKNSVTTVPVTVNITAMDITAFAGQGKHYYIRRCLV